MKQTVRTGRNFLFCTSRQITRTAIIAFTALFLIACTAYDEPDTGTALPDGRYPMTFSTAVEGLTVTRANTVKGEWTTGDEVAVKVGDAVKKYKPTGDGTSSTLTCEDAANPFYWQKTTETVSAWCDGTGTYNGTQPKTWTLQTDQSGNGYQQSDLLYAKPQTLTYNNGASNQLTFNHLPAKVIINLKAGDGITDQEVQAATVSLINQATTSGTIGEDGTVAPATSGTAAITPNPLGTAATGYLKSVQALVVPQQMQNKQFIQVTLGSTYNYYYTPTGNDANLVSGQQYTYNITVKNGYLEVTKATGGAWDGGGTVAVVSKTLAEGFSATDLKIGDFYYSDGTTSDGGYRKYTDNTTALLPVMPVLTDGSGNPRTVIGIVYSTEVKRIGAAAQEVLKEKGVANPHGLVMALTDASEGCQWGAKNDENSNGSTGEPFKDNTGTLQQKYNNVDGYGETQWIINTYDDTTLKNTYTAFYHANRYGKAEGGTAQYTAPSNTTGWFIPSMGQWWDILSNLGGIDLSSYQSSSESLKDIPDAGTTALGNMNKYLEKISGATQFSQNTRFWSSSELNGNDACFVLFYVDGSLHLNQSGKDWEGGHYRVRCTLAF